MSVDITCLGILNSAPRVKLESSSKPLRELLENRCGRWLAVDPDTGIIGLSMSDQGRTYYVGGDECIQKFIAYVEADSDLMESDSVDTLIQQMKDNPTVKMWWFLIDW